MAVIEISAYSKKNKDKKNLMANSFKILLKKWNLIHFYTKCCICGWNRCEINLAHLIPYQEGGDYSCDNIVPLCPNHQKQFKEDRLLETERERIQYFLWSVCNQISPF